MRGRHILQAVRRQNSGMQYGNTTICIFLDPLKSPWQPCCLQQTPTWSKLSPASLGATVRHGHMSVVTKWKSGVYHLLQMCHFYFKNEVFAIFYFELSCRWSKHMWRRVFSYTGAFGCRHQYRINRAGKTKNGKAVTKGKIQGGARNVIPLIVNITHFNCYKSIWHPVQN